MKTIPEYIKQKGYIAQKKTDYYAVQHMSGGHIPSEDYVELSIDEMTRLYFDHSLNKLLRVFTLLNTR